MPRLPADQGLRFERILGFCPSRRSKSPKGLREDGPVSASRVGVSKRSPQKGGRKPELEAEALLFAPSAPKMQETRNKMPATLEQKGGN